MGADQAERPVELHQLGIGLGTQADMGAKEPVEMARRAGQICRESLNTKSATGQMYGIQSRGQSRVLAFGFGLAQQCVDYSGKTIGCEIAFLKCCKFGEARICRVPTQDRICGLFYGFIPQQGPVLRAHPRPDPSVTGFEADIVSLGRWAGDDWDSWGVVMDVVAQDDIRAPVGQDQILTV